MKKTALLSFLLSTSLSLGLISPNRLDACEAMDSEDFQVLFSKRVAALKDYLQDFMIKTSDFDFDAFMVFCKRCDQQRSSWAFLIPPKRVAFAPSSGYPTAPS